MRIVTIAIAIATVLALSEGSHEMTDPRLVSSTAISEMMKRPSEDTRLAYSIPEAVTISGIGRTLLYAEIAAGRLLAVKAGRRTLIPRTALERFISTLPSATANGFIRLTNKTVERAR